MPPAPGQTTETLRKAFERYGLRVYSIGFPVIGFGIYRVCPGFQFRADLQGLGGGQGSM